MQGLTQEELGERTELSKGYISQLEREISSPSIETLFHLLEVLGISAKDFFDEDALNKGLLHLMTEHKEYLATGYFG
jgi:transcriptional regulator with XRE-family HTH domain